MIDCQFQMTWITVSSTENFGNRINVVALLLPYNRKLLTSSGQLKDTEPSKSYFKCSQLGGFTMDLPGQLEKISRKLEFRSTRLVATP